MKVHQRPSLLPLPTARLPAALGSKDGAFFAQILDDGMRHSPIPAVRQRSLRATAPATPASPWFRAGRPFRPARLRNP